MAEEQVTTGEKGAISVDTENLLPIIKKFLYSDTEIFLRELVSNGVDAVSKLKKLARIGEFNGQLDNARVRVSFDKDAKTITVSDDGLGMSADEVKKYINQIAFSGAVDFAKKYKDTESEHLIGNFGLGFYSAFMVAQNVEVITKSYREGAQAVRWLSDGTTEFSLEPTEKENYGTNIILHLNDDSEEFLDEYRLKGILTKYCRFLPVPIDMIGDDIEEEVKDKDGKETGEKVTKPNITQVNTTQPIWTKTPADLKDEDYKNFYRELYPMAPEPLFWIHLNVDYPFNLTGVLYFPPVKNTLEVQRDKIQLYCRQVFVTDEAKEVVPEFLTLLHGVIDSPDIPLNVSRSYLQSDSNVKKINNHITKKVADKLHELFKDDRKNFEDKWKDISVFVKFGMITDDRFYDRSKTFALVTNTDGKSFTFDEYTQHVEANQKDKNNKVIWLYTNNPEVHHTYIAGAKKRGYDVLVLDNVLDSHFIQNIESKLTDVSLKRVDADSLNKLIEKEEEAEQVVLNDDEQKKLKEVFETAIDNKGYSVEIVPGTADELPVTVTQPEFMRRMAEMSKLQGASMFGDLPEQLVFNVNGNHPLAAKILAKDNDAQKSLAKQAADLALLSQNKLTGAGLTSFIERSVSILASQE